MDAVQKGQFVKFESVTRVQRDYRHLYIDVPSNTNNIRRREQRLEETGTLLDEIRPVRHEVAEQTVAYNYVTCCNCVQCHRLKEEVKVSSSNEKALLLTRPEYFGRFWIKKFPSDGK